MSYATNPTWRRCQRVLASVVELHKRGYQRLRISPGIAPTGLAWRCILAPASRFETGGLLLGPRASWDDGSMVVYSSAQEAEYFGWPDVTTASARELADAVEARCPRLINESRGQDWPYSGWLIEILGYAERRILPSAYDDSWPKPDWYPQGIVVEGAQDSPLRLPAPPAPPDA